MEEKKGGGSDNSTDYHGRNSMSLTLKPKTMILNQLKSSFKLQNWEIISPVNYTV